jgi:uncharacterized phage protein gp47/JayE
MTVPSYEDLFSAFRRRITLGPSRFGIAIVDTEGSDVNIIGHATATVGQAVALYGQQRFNGQFLSTAAKRTADLEQWVYDRYGLRRRRAHAAVVTLALSRSNAIGFTLPERAVFGTEAGVNFETLNAVPFAAAQRGPLFVNAVAQVVGHSGNVLENTITRKITASEDTTLVVRNLERAAGGTEEQTDEELAAAAQAFFLASTCGTDVAILAATLNTPGIANAFVDEPLNGDGTPAGMVRIVFSDGSGGGNTPLRDRLIAALRSVRGFGVPVFATPGVPVFADIVASTLAFRAGFDSTNVLADARRRVVAVVNATGPNRTLLRAAIVAALQGTPGLVVPDGALNEPAGDLVPATGEVIRTSPDRVALNGQVG